MPEGRRHRAGPDGPERISLADLRAQRLRAQQLEPRLARGALLDAVHALVGVNAQLPSAMALALRARVADLTLDQVEASRAEARAVVRTWCMRGTLHLLRSDELEWLLSAVPAATLAGGWRWLEKRAGLERRRAARVAEAAVQVLRPGGPLTRPALMAALARQFGAEVKPAAAGLVWLLGMQGRAAFGPDQGSDPTYVALEDWLGCPPRLQPPAGHAELARRYLRGYGPADPRDMAAWWGLPVTQARAAWRQIQDELVELEAEGLPLWRLSGQPAAPARRSRKPSVRLVPAFDTYLLGYAARDFVVAREDQPRVFHGGQVVPVVLVDGGAAGTWRHERQGRQIRITAQPFSTFTPVVRDLVAAEADDIGRFFGLQAALSFSRPD